jgi:formyltetrahydrofolate synthetase
MSDIEIAQKAVMKPIAEIGASLGIAAEHLEAIRPLQSKDVT